MGSLRCPFFFINNLNKTHTYGLSVKYASVSIHTVYIHTYITLSLSSVALSSLSSLSPSLSHSSLSPLSSLSLSLSLLSSLSHLSLFSIRSLSLSFWLLSLSLSLSVSLSLSLSPSLSSLPLSLSRLSLSLSLWKEFSHRNVIFFSFFYLFPPLSPFFCQVLNLACFIITLWWAVNIVHANVKKIKPWHVSHIWHQIKIANPLLEKPVCLIAMNITSFTTKYI